MKKYIIISFAVLIFGSGILVSKVQAAPTIEEVRLSLIEAIETLITKLTLELNLLLKSKTTGGFNSTNTATTTVNTTTNTNLQVSGQCSMQSTNFTCQHLSQGSEYDPKNPPETVCGCKPISCPADKPYVISYRTNEKWSDGSQKGNFICESEFPS